MKTLMILALAALLTACASKPTMSYQQINQTYFDAAALSKRSHQQTGPFTTKFVEHSKLQTYKTK